MFFSLPAIGRKSKKVILDPDSKASNHCLISRKSVSLKAADKRFTCKKENSYLVFTSLKFNFACIDAACNYFFSLSDVRRMLVSLQFLEQES